MKKGVTTDLQKDPRYKGKFTEQEFDVLGEKTTETITIDQFNRGLAARGKEAQEKAKAQTEKEVLEELNRNRGSLSEDIQKLLDRVNQASGMVPDTCPTP